MFSLLGMGHDQVRLERSQPAPPKAGRLVSFQGRGLALQGDGVGSGMGAEQLWESVPT